MNDNEQINFEDTQAFPIEDVIDFSGVQVPQKAAPEASVRNRAAMLSLLSSEPDQIVADYQLFLSENQEGRSTTLDQVEKGILDNLKIRNFDVGLMDILSDEGLTTEQKEAAINEFNNNPEHQDLTSAFTMESIISPSEGENFEAEESRTTAGTEVFKNLDESIAREQAIVNMAMQDWAAQSTIVGEVSGVAEMLLVPGEEGLKTSSLINSFANIAGEDTPWSKIIKGFFRPGASIEDMREEYSVLLPEERIEFLNTAIEAITRSSSVVIPRSSQLQALRMLEKLVGDYSPTEAAFDTAINALDIIFPVIGAVKVAKAGRARHSDWDSDPDSFKEVVETSKLTEEQAGDLAMASKPSAPTGSPNYQRIQQLEKEHTDLLQASQQLQEPGAVSRITSELQLVEGRINALNKDVRAQVKQLQVSQGLKYSEARKRVEAQISEQLTDLNATKTRLTNMLDANADSATAYQRIKAIEDELEILRKDKSVVPLKKNAIIDGLDRANLNGVSHMRNPASPGSIFMATNPQKARVAVKAALEAQGDDVAIAAFGVSKNDVMADIALPKLTTESGIVPAKPVGITRELSPDNIVDVPEDVMRHARAGTGDELTDKELQAGYSIVKNDFLNATGVNVVEGMDGFRMSTDGAHIKISSIYGGSEGSFLLPEDAIEQLQRVFRNYGVEADNVTVMMKDGVNYVPVELDKVIGRRGEYYARVEIEHRIDSSDLGDALEGFTLKRNWMDSIGVTVSENAGSLTRMMVDAASIFDSKIMRGASRAADKAASLGKSMARMAADFTNIYNTLSKERKLALNDYIFQANRDGIKFNPVALQGRFSEKELEALTHFRRFWDSHFFLENLDVVRSLRAGKFGLLDNGKDRFFAKPVPKQYSLNRVYDPDSATVRNLTPEEMTQLYDRGGSVAELKSAEKIAGEDITHIISDPTKTSYLRKIKDDDVALNYREGYYQVTYKSNHFIYEVGPDGAEGAVKAVAGSAKDAEFTAKRLAQTTGKTYGVRGDDRIIPRDSKEYWELNSSSGRIAQRYRGQPLVEANASNVVGTQQFIEGPVDAAIRAANSIANRTSYRQVIDTIKERAVRQYADVFPKNDFNQTRWPTSLSEIAKKGEGTSKQLRDARTTFEYVNYLEKGYINHLDEGFKYAFLWVAEAAGKGSLNSGAIASNVLEAIEKGGYAAVRSGVTPTNLGKGFVFFNYIVANMFRQWIIQPAQALRMVAYNPQGFFSANPHKLVMQFLNEKYLTKGKSSDFTKFVDESGMIDAIDQSSLVRNTLMTASERSNWYNKSLGRGTDLMRKAGYDLGETMNLLGHLSFVYDKFGREGKNLKDVRVRSEAAHLARQMSYGFNSAGDFPYTHNAAAIVTQFLQVPHKAILQITNRSIPVEVRRRMFVGDLLLYGPPTALMYSLFGPDFLKDDPELKDAVVNGLMHQVINFAATELYGDEVDVAWGDSLSPYDFGGFSKVVESALTDGGLAEMLSNTPAGGLIMKDGSRVQKAILSSMRYMGLAADTELKPETFKDVLNNIASITSMWNNYQKGKLVLETQRLLNKHGQVMAENVNSFEAVAIMMGFQPSEVANLYEASVKIREKNKAYEDEIRKTVGTIVEVAVGKTKQSIDHPDTVASINQLLLAQYKEDPFAMKIVREQLGFYYRDPQVGLENAILKAVINPNLGHNIGELVDAIEDPEKKAMVRRIHEDSVESLKSYQQTVRGN